VCSLQGILTALNIFVLDKDPILAAHYHCDKHVVKMCVELYQQLGSAVIRYGATPAQMPLTAKGAPLKESYPHHPCTLWVGTNQANFKWASEHALGLCWEYTARYDRAHFCEAGIDHLRKMIHMLPEGELTPFHQAMPAQYKNADDVVEAYRNYYIGEKWRFAKWAKINNTPYWWVAPG